MRYDAKAIGSGSEGAQTEIQEHFHKVQLLQILVAFFFLFKNKISLSPCCLGRN